MGLFRYKTIIRITKQLFGRDYTVRISLDGKLPKAVGVDSVERQTRYNHNLCRQSWATSAIAGDDLLVAGTTTPQASSSKLIHTEDSPAAPRLENAPDISKAAPRADFVYGTGEQ